jgi:hypothetical protein
MVIRRGCDAKMTRLISRYYGNYSAAYYIFLLILVNMLSNLYAYLYGELSMQRDVSEHYTIKYF